MSVFSLRWGDGELPLPISGASTVDVLEEKPVEAIADVPAAFLRAMEAPVSSPPLKALIAPGDDVTIVISDITRAWMRQDIVTELLIRYLHDDMRIPYDQITVLVAIGSHRKQTPEEMVRIASPFAAEHVRIHNHDCQAKDLVFLGVTSRGTPVRVNPLAVGRKVILIGGTIHHMIAGYGGGRKSVLPGISSWETIQKNHSHALDPHFPRSNPLIGVGKLRNNPVHEDMMEAARMVNPCFSISLVVGGGGQYLGIVGGGWEEAWLESCRLVDQAFGVTIPAAYDVVIASAGGFPRDINLYQGCKGLINAMQAVRPGGEVIFLAECREGGGPPQFFDWLEPQREGRLDSALRADFTIAGYIFYAICEMCQKARVSMLTTLRPDQAGVMGIHAFDRLDDLLRQVAFAGKRVLVLPNGGTVVPRIAE